MSSVRIVAVHPVWPMENALSENEVRCAFQERDDD
jgi:hypothetical protein